jgi:hypothetical protein
VADDKTYSHAQGPPDPALFPGQRQPDTFVPSLHRPCTDEFYRSRAARRLKHEKSGKTSSFLAMQAPRTHVAVYKMLRRKKCSIFQVSIQKKKDVGSILIII